MSSKKQKQMAVRELSEVGAVEQLLLHALLVTSDYKSILTRITLNLCLD